MSLMKQFGTVSYTGSLMEKDRNGRLVPKTITYNMADLSEGEVNTGNHYEFDSQVKTRPILHPADAQFLIRNAKKLSVNVAGVKLQKRQVTDEELVPDDGTEVSAPASKAEAKE